MKKSRSKFLKIVDEKHDINFHWPNMETANLFIYKFTLNMQGGRLDNRIYSPSKTK